MIQEWSGAGPTQTDKQDHRNQVKINSFKKKKISKDQHSNKNANVIL